MRPRPPFDRPRRRIRALRASLAALLAVAVAAAAPAARPAHAEHAFMPTLGLTPDSALAAEIRRTLDAGPPAAVTRRAWERAADLYADAGIAPLWLRDGAPGERVAALVRAIGRADEHGLRRADYPLRALGDALAAVRDAVPRAADVARADVLLTATFAAYADDMLTGRLDPRDLEAAWHIDARRVDVDSAVRRTLRAARLDDALARLVPREEGYDALVRGLARYRDLAAAGGWAAIPEGPTMRPGDTTATVRALRDRLRAEGYDAPGPRDGGTPVYGAADSTAVAHFQARHGLVVDGLVGPRTRAALNVDASRRAAQIAANLERLRWLPELGDRRIVVNIPAFRLDAYDGERRALTMRVVVGDELASRRTPVFADSMSYVQFGPYWNVPRGIALEEILPKARDDRGYLARNGYEVVRGWGDDAPVVDPWGLSYAELRSSRHRVRQRPGADNALGRVKFMFPNEFAVYLHDTPAQALFDERRRAYSHGCVRVADPAALAGFVLSRRDAWDASRIDAALANGERTRVDLATKIPVYLVYLTAFEQDGRVAFREDLYDRDDGLRAALGPVASAAETESLVRRLHALVE